MLRKSSRPIPSKQALMSDYGTIPISPTGVYNKNPTSSFFNSPRTFNNFTSKGSIDSESLISPTSILDSKSSSSSSFSNPFWSDSSTPKTPKDNHKVQWEKLDSRGVGLGILDSDSKQSKPDSPAVIFGSKLKIEIPPLIPFVNLDSPKSPGDFGIKTRNSQLGLFSPASSVKKPSNPPRVLSGLSITEMELSEEYTCVISHGPNPKTTHIFDDCVIESSYGDVGGGNEKGCLSKPSISYPSDDFLSFCYNCKKNLHQGNDIYIYRGEKAFCSSECRYKEMMKEEATEMMEFPDMYEKIDVHGFDPRNF